MKTRNILLTAVLVLVAALPAHAVFDEGNLAGTLSGLRGELKSEKDRLETTQAYLSRSNSAQHGKMVKMIQQCNELSLMLYSQNQDYTFDVSYALKQATKEYEDFNNNKMPYDDIVAKLDIEIDRYSRLIESLKRIPPQKLDDTDIPDSLAYHNDTVDFSVSAADQRRLAYLLDSTGRADRDSCLVYAKDLLLILSQSKDLIIQDNEDYQEMNDRLKESYDYAENRYKLIQKKIFVEGQDNYITVLKNFGFYCKRAFTDLREKNHVHAFLAVAAGLLGEFLWILLITLISTIVRLDKGRRKHGINIYMPMVALGLLVILARIFFLPNRMLNLLLPPVLLTFTACQLVICHRNRTKVAPGDRALGWLTLVLMAACMVMSFMGYILMAIQFLMWWLFQIGAIETIMAVYELLGRFERTVLKKQIDSYNATRPVGAPKPQSGENIRVTWFHDFVMKAAMPVLAILTVPFSIWVASDIFDLTEICKNIFFSPIVDLYDASGNHILHCSLYKIVLVSSLYFIFRYVSYAAKALYFDLKVSLESRRRAGAHIHTNQINFTLANNVIAILVWGIYVIAAILILRIPMGAISIVAAGLATGVGLALKDVLNNFIYGIQLMSGRLRVGDWLECDGVRGKVTAISYQSTQIETIDGAVMSFLNTALFSKNFKNLTRNNSYEFVKIIVGVNYGADVDKVREILLTALKQLQVKDRFRRDIVDLKKGVSVAFEEFSESSVDLAVKQYVLVTEKAGYISRAKEVIYNALNEAGIEIPFPQRDIHIKND